MPSPTSHTMRVDVVGGDAVACERDRAVDERLGHRSACIGLEGDGLQQPALAEAVQQGGEVGVARGARTPCRSRACPPARSRADEAGLGQQCRADAGLRGRAGMHALGPAAVGEILDDAGGQAAGDADGVGEGGGGQDRARRRSRRRRRRRRSRRWDESRPCASPAARPGDIRHISSTPAAMPFITASPPRPRCSATASTAGTIDRAGMHRAALEGVVEVLAMGGGAVDERGVVGAHARVSGRSRWRRRPTVRWRGLRARSRCRGRRRTGRRRRASAARIPRARACGSLRASSQRRMRPTARAWRSGRRRERRRGWRSWRFDSPCAGWRSARGRGSARTRMTESQRSRRSAMRSSRKIEWSPSESTRERR